MKMVMAIIKPFKLDDVREGRDELQQNFKSVLQAGLGKLDLVTREEFDVQRAVLLRTREQVDALQRTVSELEALLSAASGDDPKR